MNGTMSATEKVRVGIFMDEEVRAALRAEAGARGLDMSDLAEELLRAALADEIERIKKKRQAERKKGGEK
jgi:plasmid stability protein